MQPPAPPDYVASPLGSFPELAQMYSSSFSSPVSNAKTDAQYSQDQVTVENQRKAQAAAEAAARARADAYSDPSKYTVNQRDDGGFGFYDPEGKEITAAQYAANTHQKLTDILKESQNPIDIRYVQDQQNFTKYLQAKSQAKYDKGQAAIAKQIENDVNNAGFKWPDGSALKFPDANPIKFRDYMQSNYPTIYGANRNNAPGFSGSSTSLPGYDTAVNQLGGTKKVNKKTNSSSSFGSNPTGG